ncbi:hypothetical protein [Allocoleopsis sp.]|uniref:hypothetical protein n=1 Tax=Allocoleopsis sp. TaxID=3088169 RepID=UPI002FD2B0CC
MLKWLNDWRRAISRGKPAVEEQPPQPPTTFLHPAPRETVAQTLPYQIAVDPLESSLFYRSLEGKIVSRSLASGAIQWQSEASGYPLRVTDQILWAVQSDAISAYSITDGQLLMRSNPVWLPGEVIHSLCDLSQQTLRIDLLCVHRWMGGTPVPNPYHEDSAAYQISLITGAVIEIYQFNNDLGEKARYHWPNLQAVQGQVYPKVSGEQLLKINVAERLSESAQLHTASVIIHNYYTKGRTQRIVLSVFSNQPPYSKQWEAIIKEFWQELPHC